jgi:Domain of unknown function (DUF4706)
MPSHDNIRERFEALMVANNPIALKISRDIEEIETSYEKLWLDMQERERENIVDEMIIKPEISLRYFDNFSSSSESEDNDKKLKNGKKKGVASAKRTKSGYQFDGKNLHTYCTLKTDSNRWDEHSAPFLMKTKSQINMNHLFHDKNVPMSASMKSHAKSSPLAKSVKKVIDDEANETKVMLANILNSSVGIFNQQAVTRKSLPPPPLPPTMASSPSLEDDYNQHENDGETVLLKQSSKTMTTSKVSGDHTFFFSKLNGQNKDDLVSSDSIKIKYSNISPQSSSASSLGNSSNLLGAIVSSECENNSTKIDSELETLLSNTQGFDFLNNW